MNRSSVGRFTADFGASAAIAEPAQPLKALPASILMINLVFDFIRFWYMVERQFLIFFGEVQASWRHALTITNPVRRSKVSTFLGDPIDSEPLRLESHFWKKLPDLISKHFLRRDVSHPQSPPVLFMERAVSIGKATTLEYHKSQHSCTGREYWLRCEASASHSG